MTELVLDDVLARRFLLGQISPEEQGRIQELAFEDPDTFEFLESVENDLIDDFIQGDLSATEVGRFESHFLSLPGRRNNLDITRMWQQHLEQATPVSHEKRFSILNWFRVQSFWLQVSVAAVAALVLVGLVVWILARARVDQQPVPLQAGHDRPAAIPTPELRMSPSQEPTSSPSHAENKPKNQTPQKQKRLLAYAVLLPSASPRGANVQPLKLAHDSPIMTVELVLIIQKSFRTYEASLENESGTAIQRWTNLHAEVLTNGKALRLEVPSDVLKSGEFYRLVVSGASGTGTEVIARYPFEVVN
jgi:hypothetical protein